MERALLVLLSPRPTNKKLQQNSLVGRVSVERSRERREIGRWHHQRVPGRVRGCVVVVTSRHVGAGRREGGGVEAQLHKGIPVEGCDMRTDSSQVEQLNTLGFLLLVPVATHNSSLSISPVACAAAGGDARRPRPAGDVIRSDEPPGEPRLREAHPGSSSLRLCEGVHLCFVISCGLRYNIHHTLRCAPCARSPEVVRIRVRERWMQRCKPGGWAIAVSDAAASH